jgi:hypothetical protein
VDPLEHAKLSEIVQISTDGILRDVEVVYQIGYHHFSLQTQPLHDGLLTFFFQHSAPSPA